VFPRRLAEVGALPAGEEQFHVRDHERQEFRWTGLVGVGDLGDTAT
jgi:hypothetical protein